MKKRSINKKSLEKYLQEILEDVKLHRIWFYPQTQKETFWEGQVEIEGDGLTFSTLEKLSMALSTKKINIGSNYEGPGCPTCDFGALHIVQLRIQGATIPERYLK